MSPFLKASRFLSKFFFIAFVVFSPGNLCAEGFDSPEHGFSINPPQGWIQRPGVYEGVLITYWRENSLATFHIIERDLEGVKKVSELKWEDLFSPKFEEIHIRQEAETSAGGEKARYCIYTIKPGPFKQQMEGKGHFKYMNYVIIKNGRLYSITFKDLESAFGLNYPGFLAAVRSIRFYERQTPAGSQSGEADRNIVHSSRPERTENI